MTMQVQNTASGGVVGGNSITIPKWQYYGEGQLFLWFHANASVTGLAATVGAVAMSVDENSQAGSTTAIIWLPLQDATFDDIVITWTGAADATAFALDVANVATSPDPWNFVNGAQGTPIINTSSLGYQFTTQGGMGMVGADQAITLDPVAAFAGSGVINLDTKPANLVNFGTAFLDVRLDFPTSAGAIPAGIGISGNAAMGGANGRAAEIVVLEAPVAAFAATASVNQSVAATSASVFAWADGGDGSAITWAWTQVSGPNTATFTDAADRFTDATGLIPGVYVFQISGTQGAANDTDTVTVTVSAAAYTVDAGADQSIVVDNTSVTATHTGTGPFTNVWTQVSGPNAATFGAAGADTTTITGLVDGTYVFQSSGTDTSDASTANDTITIGVNVPLAVDPMAPASITDGATANPTATVTPGTGTGPYTYAWVETTALGSTISDPTIANPVLTPTAGPGTYTFEVTVTDTSDASTATQTITVTVTAAAVGGGVKNAQLVKLCTFASPLSACDTTDPNNPVPILFVPVLDANSKVIPVGSTTYSPGDGSGPDIAGNYASYFTDSTGTVIAAPAAWSFDCASGSSKDVELGYIIDTADTTVDPIPVQANYSTDGAGVVSVEYISLIDGSTIVPAGTQQFVDDDDRFDYERSKFCVRDATGTVVTRVTRVRVWDTTDTSDVVGETVAPVAERLINDADGTTYVLGAGETLGDCDVYQPLVESGCLVDTTNNTIRAARQIVQFANGVYDWANPTYVNPADGTAITPLGTEVYQDGPCGVPCATCP